MDDDVPSMTFDALFALSPGGPSTWRAPGAPAPHQIPQYRGLLLGQAVVAGTPRPPPCHALHALFLRSGRKRQSFEADVQRVRDGRNFSTRGIKIRQGDRILLEAYSSHHDGEPGPRYQDAMPEVPPPDAFEDQYLHRRRRALEKGVPCPDYLAERLLDARPIESDPDPSRRTDGRRSMWIRPRRPIDGGVAIHQAAIAFASDLGLVHVGLQGHRARGGARVDATSLDHGIWFHREARADDWLLHVQRARIVTDGRGFAEASIFARNGELVASAAQEFLARNHDNPGRREKHDGH